MYREPLSTFYPARLPATARIAPSQLAAVRRCVERFALPLQGAPGDDDVGCSSTSPSTPSTEPLHVGRHVSPRHELLAELLVPLANIHALHTALVEELADGISSDSPEAETANILALWLVHVLRYFALPPAQIRTTPGGVADAVNHSADDDAIAERTAGAILLRVADDAGDERDPLDLAARHDLSGIELADVLSRAEVYDGRLFLFCLDARNAGFASRLDRDGDGDAPDWLDEALDAATNRCPPPVKGATSERGGSVSRASSRASFGRSGEAQARRLREALRPRIPIASRGVQLALSRRFTTAQVERAVKNLVEICFATDAATSADATKASVVEWMQPFCGRLRAEAFPDCAIAELVFFFNVALRSRVQRRDIVDWSRYFVTYLPPAVSFRTSFCIDVQRLWWALPLDRRLVDGVTYFLKYFAVQTVAGGASDFVVASLDALSNAAEGEAVADASTMLQSLQKNDRFTGSLSGSGDGGRDLYTVEKVQRDLRDAFDTLAISATAVDDPLCRQLLAPLVFRSRRDLAEVASLVLFSLQMEPFVPGGLTTRAMMAQRLIVWAECLKASALCGSPFHVAETVWRDGKKAPPPAGTVWRVAPVSTIRRPSTYFPDLFALQLNAVDGDSAAPNPLPPQLLFRVVFGPRAAEIQQLLSEPSLHEPATLAAVATLDRVRAGASGLVIDMRAPPSEAYERHARATVLGLVPRNQAVKASQLVEQLLFDAREVGDAFLHDPAVRDVAAESQRLDAALRAARDFIGTATELTATGARSALRDAPILHQAVVRGVMLSASAATRDSLPDRGRAAPPAAGTLFDDAIVRDHVGPPLATASIADVVDIAARTVERSHDSRVGAEHFTRDLEPETSLDAPLSSFGLGAARAPDEGAAACSRAPSTSVASSYSPQRARARLRVQAQSSWLAAVLHDLYRFLHALLRRLREGAAGHNSVVLGADIVQLTIQTLEAAAGRNLHRNEGKVLRSVFGLGAKAATSGLHALLEELEANEPQIGGSVPLATDESAPFTASSTNHKRALLRAKNLDPTEEYHRGVAERCVERHPELRPYGPELTAAAFVLCACTERVSGGDEAAAPREAASPVTTRFSAVVEAVARLTCERLALAERRATVAGSSSSTVMRRPTMPAHSPPGRVVRRVVPRVAPLGSTKAASSGLDDETLKQCQKAAALPGFGDISRHNYAMPMVEAAYDRLKDVNGYVPLSSVLAEVEAHKGLAASAPVVKREIVEQLEATSRTAFQDLREFCASPSPWVRQMKEIFGPPDYFTQQQPYRVVALTEYAAVQLQLASL
jgi:hypothetical protein